MHIQFERTGGFAGIQLKTTLDSESLSADDAATLRDLLHAASFFDLPPNQKTTPGADRFHYEISVKIDHRQHAIEIDEPAVPPSLRPFLDWLLEKAKTP